MTDVRIETGIDGDTQESSYMNGTLQVLDDGKREWAMTIHTNLSVPERIVAKGEAEIAAYVRGQLQKCVAALDGRIDFEVEIGRNEAFPDDEEEG